jgi:asparagine synthetase B (glutamine-hydrolysing)
MSFQGGTIFAARDKFGLQPLYKKFQTNNLIAKLVNLGRL